MGILIDLGLLSLSGAGLIGASIYAVRGASAITRVPNYKSDDFLSRAHRNLEIAAIVGWITVVILVIIIVLYVLFGLETAAFTGGFFIKIILFLAIVAAFAVGLLAAYALSDMGKSPNLAEAKKEGAHNDAIITSILGFSATGIILIVFIIKFFQRQKVKKEQKEVKELKQVELVKIAQGAKEKGELRQLQIAEAKQRLLKEGISSE